MEALVLLVLKVFLILFAVVGVIFHLLALKRPEDAKKMEEVLDAEHGLRKKIVPWLETNRMNLHERLINSRGYNILALIFLLALLVFFVQL